MTLFDATPEPPDDEALAAARRRMDEARTAAGVPVARIEDPWTSHVAAQRIEPSRTSRKGLVLGILRAAHGAWLPGTAFVGTDAGGSEGLRRLRELRQTGGFPIERRPAPGSKTSWEYRLPEGA